MNFVILDKQGKNLAMWTPGVENSPKEKKHRPFRGGTLAIRFPREVPDSILAAKPVSMLIQCVDESRVRVGFRARSNDPWFMSEIYDVKATHGSEIGAFGMHCWSTTTGRTYGAEPGGPMYQKFLIDYVRYRYGLSTSRDGKGTHR
jgi:hypothetical protein